MFLDESELKKLLDTVYLIWFAVGCTLMVVKLTARVQEYRKAKWKVPLFVWRDICLFGGLAFPFLAIFAVRVADLTEEVMDQLIWSVGTGTPAVLGVTIAVYVEFVKLRGKSSREVSEAIPEEGPNH